MEWKKYWEDKATKGGSDFEFDRGRSIQGDEIERMSAEELLEFIAPGPDDVVFDAGCGSGTASILLQPRVKTIVAMDYSESAVDRYHRKIADSKLPNIRLLQGDMARIPLRRGSVDKVVCLSVLQYLNDIEARRALEEAVRILKNNGLIILHVKNLASPYLASLWLAKRVKRSLGLSTKMEHVRPYGWYVRALESLGAEVVGYNSFNVFVVEGMPRRMVQWVRRLELRRRRTFPMSTPVMRRHGAELKIRARVHRDD